jgi:hypothetical protein
MGVDNEVADAVVVAVEGGCIRICGGCSGGFEDVLPSED